MTLNASARISTDCPSRTLTLRTTAASMFQAPGCKTLLRPTLPKVPGALFTNAARLIQLARVPSPCQSAITFARSCKDAAACDAVNEVSPPVVTLDQGPVWAVIIPDTCQPLATRRSRVEANCGVCAMTELLKICRRSDAQLPRSCRRLYGFITMAEAWPRSPPASASE